VLNNLTGALQVTEIAEALKKWDSGWAPSTEVCGAYGTWGYDPQKMFVKIQMQICAICCTLMAKYAKCTT